ncbi:unnamed protein product, partial [Phaeothamnion confervicola]
RRDVLSAAGATIVAFSAALPVLADTSLISAKKAYFRYTPRISTGMVYFAKELKPAVDGGKWDIVAKAFVEEVTAQENSRRPDVVKPKSSKIQRDLLDPMKIWAQTFAVKGTGPKLRALTAEIEKLEAALDTLEAVATMD